MLRTVGVGRGLCQDGNPIVGTARQEVREQALRLVAAGQHDLGRRARVGFDLFGKAAAVVERFVVRQLVQQQLEAAAPKLAVPELLERQAERQGVVSRRRASVMLYER